MPHPPRTIVAGVASLDGPDPVLPHAAETARELGAVLHVVHAFEPPAAPAGELLARLEARLRADAPGAEAVCHVAEGSAVECLPALARRVGAGLLVVGATRRNRVWLQFLGTTAEGVVRRAEVPVLVQRSSLHRGVHRVLVATDLSEPAAEVHERGLDLVDALCRGCRPDLRSLLVVQDAAAAAGPGRAALEGAGQRALDAFVRARRPRGRGVQCKVRLGPAADGILAEAADWEADLLVLGTRGRTGSAGLALGSTAGATLRAAGCSVLVVPPAARGAETPERSEVTATFPAPLPAA